MPLALGLEYTVTRAAPLQDDVPHGIPLLILPQYISLFGLFDQNPVHFSDEAARELGFDGRIAHGMLGVSAAAADIDNSLSPLDSISEISVRFRKPVYPGKILVPSYTINGQGIGLEMSIDGKIAIEGHAKTGLRHLLFPFEISRYLPTIDDINVFNSRIFLGNPSIDPRSLSVGDRYIVICDHVSLADEIKRGEGGYNHFIRGMLAIDPLPHVSRVLGNQFPGNGAIYMSQEGIFAPEIPFALPLRRELLVDVMVIGKKEVIDRNSGERSMRYTLATNVFGVYNRMPSCPITHAYKVFEGTAGVMVRNESLQSIN